jgi:hypothetical protein
MNRFSAPNIERERQFQHDEWYFGEGIGAAIAVLHQI